ncbi:MAG: hypothetical protein ACOZDD_04255 [Bacteroidota bacterium]
MNIFRNFTLVVLVLLFAPAKETLADILISNGLTHEFRLAAGQKTTGSIHLVNASKEIKSARLYQTDYFFNHLGESRYDPPGTLARSNASWINVSQLFVTLQPGEERVVEFEVTLPASDTLKGTYWSVIMAEGLGVPDPGKVQQGISINTVLRYAIQIITHIEDTGERNLEFAEMKLSGDPDARNLEVNIKNTGESGLRPNLVLELFNDQGLSQGFFRTDPKRLYPGTSAKFLIPVPGITSGNYSGVLIADCENDYLFGTNVSIEF